MSLLDCLRRFREKCLAGDRRWGPVWDSRGVLLDCADGDQDLFWRALQLLNRCSPDLGHCVNEDPTDGRDFYLFAEGAEPAIEGDHFDIVYRRDRSPTEIAAVIGKAATYAARMEAAA